MGVSAAAATLCGGGGGGMCLIGTYAIEQERETGWTAEEQIEWVISRFVGRNY
jgi:hypothetical protein